MPRCASVKLLSGFGALKSALKPDLGVLSRFGALKNALTVLSSWIWVCPQESVLSECFQSALKSWNRCSQSALRPSSALKTWNRCSQSALKQCPQESVLSSPSSKVFQQRPSTTYLESVNCRVVGLVGTRGPSSPGRLPIHIKLMHCWSVF